MQVIKVNLNKSPVDFLEHLFSYIIATFLVLSCGWGLLYDETNEYTSKTIVEALICTLIILIILIAVLRRRYSISECAKGKSVVLIMCLTVYALVNEYNNDTYLQRFLLPILLLFVFMLFVKNRRDIWYAYSNFVILIALISLFFYIFGSILNLIPYSRLTSSSWGSWGKNTKVYYNLYYESQYVRVNSANTIRIARNIGIYTEAPMFNLVLCIALAVELFLKNKSNVIRIFLIIITILTTMSTTGFIFLFLSFLFYYFRKKITFSFILKHKYAAGIAILLICGGLGLIFLQKLMTSSGTGSTNVRMDHMICCFKSFLKNFIYGAGYRNQKAILADSQHYQGISVGLPYFLAFGGITLGGTLIAPFCINFIEVIRNKDYNEIIFELLFFCLFFFTAISSNSILLYFIVYITLYDTY